MALRVESRSSVLLRTLVNVSRIHVRFVIAALLGIMWAGAGLAKSRDMEQFNDVVRGILPALGREAAFVCIAVVVAEFVAAILLFVPRLLPLGAQLSVSLAMLFAAVNLVRMNEGLRPPCSCVGTVFTLSPAVTLALDLGVLVAGIYLGQGAQGESNVA